MNKRLKIITSMAVASHMLISPISPQVFADTLGGASTYETTPDSTDSTSTSISTPSDVTSNAGVNGGVPDSTTIPASNVAPVEQNTTNTGGTDSNSTSKTDTDTNAVVTTPSTDDSTTQTTTATTPTNESTQTPTVEVPTGETSQETTPTPTAPVPIPAVTPPIIVGQGVGLVPEYLTIEYKDRLFDVVTNKNLTGVVVSAVSVVDGKTYTSVTDDGYFILQMPAGNYKITFTKKGYKPVIKSITLK